MNHFAIVTAYHQEPLPVLERMRASVMAQQTTRAIRHYLIADGFARPELQSADVTHISLPLPHNDYGDTPRLLGAMLAIREGCSALMFLDADNILYPHHVQQACDTREESGVDVVVAARELLRPDGSLLQSVQEADRALKQVDTGCFVFFGESVYRALDWARIPRELSAMADRIFWEMLKEREPRVATTRTASLGYTTLWRSAYLAVGEEPPPGAKDLSAEIARIEHWWKTLPAPQRTRLNARMQHVILTRSVK